MKLRGAEAGPVERLELHLSYQCVQNCVFCSESGRMSRFAAYPVSRREAAAVLVRKYKEGCRHVTLTGGEPSLHPHFLEILRAAKKIGYTTYATSNGSRLANRDFAGRALPLLDELCLSVHGDTPEIHDRATRSPGSFERLLQALRHVKDSPSPPFLLTNTVITRGNIDSLQATLKFLLTQRSVRHCLFSNLAPEGRGLKNYRRLAVRLRDIGSKVPALARMAKKRGVVLRFFGVPACTLGRHWKLSNDMYWSPRVTVERKSLRKVVGLADITSLRPERKRVRPKRCERCRLNERCGGLFSAYFSAHGDRELKPFLK